MIKTLDISIHALREESDSMTTNMHTEIQLFQSTLSVRRATVILLSALMSFLFQSTLSVRRATPRAIKGGVILQISIHALREESDTITKVLQTG